MIHPTPRFLALATLLALATPAIAAADPDQRTRAVHDLVDRFFTALLANDPKTAKDLATGVDAQNAPVLDALAARYAAERQYCDAYRKLVGLGPPATISTRHRLDENLRNWAVDFSADGAAAHLFFHDLPLRNVDGAWKIDFREYDYLHAHTEQLDVLRALPDMYRQAENRLRADRERRWSIVVSRFEDVERDHREKFKEQIAQWWKLREQRCRADLQGTWNVAVDHAGVKSDRPPKFQPFNATLTLNNNGQLTIRSPHEALNRSSNTDFLSVDLHTWVIENDPLRAEWSARHLRHLKQLRGTLGIVVNDEVEVYALTGSRQ